MINLNLVNFFTIGVIAMVFAWAFNYVLKYVNENV